MVIEEVVRISDMSWNIRRNFKTVNLATLKDNRQNSSSQGADHHLTTEISQPQDRGPYNAVPGGSHYCYRLGTSMGFPGGTSGKEPACKCKRYKRCDAGSIPESGRSPAGGHATYSSVLGRRNPWTEEPGGFRSIESQRVRHDWSDSACTGTAICLLFFYFQKGVFNFIFCSCFLHYTLSVSDGHVRLFATPWTIVCQAPLTMEFSRQEYWSILSLVFSSSVFPSPVLHIGQWINNLS